MKKFLSLISIIVLIFVVSCNRKCNYCENDFITKTGKIYRNINDKKEELSFDYDGCGKYILNDHDNVEFKYVLDNDYNINIIMDNNCEINGKFYSTKNNVKQLVLSNEKVFVEYFNDQGNLEIVNKMEVIDAIYNYQFNYSIVVPGFELPYSYLVNNVDSRNSDLSNVESSLSTYLLNYNNNSDDYYFVYAKQSSINDCKSWVKEYSSNFKNNSANYHFSNYDNEDIIDGKYLYALKSKNLYDFLVFKCNEKYNVPFTFSNYQLVFACQSKQIDVLEDISNNKELNSKICLFKRIELQYNSKDKMFSDYIFQTEEGINVKTSNDIFSYVGKRIEVHSNDFETNKYCYLPLLGETTFMTVRADITDSYVILPRYIINSNSNIDLLDSNSCPSDYNDIYTKYKNQYLSAYIKDCDYNDGYYQYGLYSLEKVLEIIRGIKTN